MGNEPDMKKWYTKAGPILKLMFWNGTNRAGSDFSAIRGVLK